MLRCLTPKELADLIGRKNKKSQIKYLRENDWRFTLDADNYPKVLEITVLEKHGISQSKQPVPHPKLNLIT